MPPPDRRVQLSEQIGPDAGWVAGQMAIFLAAAIAGPAGLAIFGRPDLPGHRLIDFCVGLAAILAGLFIAWQARRDLGESMRVAPTPLDQATLVEHGWYGRVRHPLYLSVMLVLFGWALMWSSWLALGVTVLGLVFFSLKARHEEGLLLHRYPAFAGYMRRVRWRFIPGVW